MHVNGLVHVYVPPREPGPPGKLVIVLHGRGDSPAGFDWLPEALGLHGVAYLLLQAPDDYYGGWSWYDLPPNQGPGVLRSRALLTQALDELAAQGQAPADTVLFGFSQGCLMAIDVGLRYAHPLAGVCGVSGYVMWPELAATEATAHARTMPWLVTAGRQDEMVPHDLTEAGVGALSAAGIPIDFRSYDKGHTIEPRAELPALRAWLVDRLG